MRRLLAVLSFAVVACGGSDSPTGPTAVSVVGAFSLKTINGASLPAVLAQTTSGKVEVLDDLFTLNADHTYSEVGHIRTTLSNGSVTTSPESDVGTYTSANGAVQLTSTVGNGTASGSVNGNTLTVIESGFTFVYSR
jgi:hypothetical protein